MQWVKRIRVVKANQYEFYVSILILFGLSPFFMVRPVGYYDSLIGATAFLLALVCAFNAVLDGARTHWFVRGLAVMWFVLLLFTTPYVLWDVAHTETFSSR